MKNAPITFKPPYKSALADQSGLASKDWSFFFRRMMDLLIPLGAEKNFSLVNNQAVAADIEGMKFDSERESQAIVDYLIQRVTTGGGAQEKIEAGSFYAAFRPTSNNWILTGDVPTATSGVTLSVTALGQVQYVSTNLTGTASISKIAFRVRTLAAKNSQYSEVG